MLAFSGELLRAPDRREAPIEPASGGTISLAAQFLLSRARPIGGERQKVGFEFRVALSFRELSAKGRTFEALSGIIVHDATVWRVGGCYLGDNLRMAHRFDMVAGRNH
jgi:hypothetical protein